MPAGGKRPGAGRPAFKPTDSDRRVVLELAGYGAPHWKIAERLKINEDTLRKNFKHELTHGREASIAEVAESLYKKAKGNGKNSVTAAIFLLKTKGGYKETSAVEHSNPDGTLKSAPAKVVFFLPPNGRT
jgi:hypothetical protein